MSNSWHLIYGISMLCLSITCAMIGLYFVYQFKCAIATTRHRFLRLRKPNLILFFCGCSLFMLIISSPCDLCYHFIYHSRHRDLFWLWLSDFCHDLCITSMLVLISARCWLLYYDHLHSVSSVDMNWKGVIRANQLDFWLKHRNTWGDLGFITCIAIIIVVIVLIVLCSISIFALQHAALVSVHLVTLIVAVIPCCSFIFRIISSHRLKALSLCDEFQIVQEMHYLSLSTFIVIIVSILSVIHISDHEMNLILRAAVRIGDVLFCIITTYIQTEWVVAQLRQQNKRLSQNKRSLKALKPHHKTPNLTMHDILQNQSGFEMFMRHCQTEFNVEGLLFIVEVAQFKANLSNMVHDIQNRIESDRTAIPDRTSSSKSVPTAHGDYKLQPSACTDAPELDLPTLNRIKSNSADVNPMTPLPDMEQIGNWMPISEHIFKPHLKQPRNSDFFMVSSRLQCVSECDILKLQDDIKNEEEMNKINALKEEDDRMYRHAQHLFLKYIDVDSTFTINISYPTRKVLLLFFIKDKTEAFESILKMNESNDGDPFVVQTDVNPLKRSLAIKEYLYTIFDWALNEVWKLLSDDSYLRFMQTKEYQYILKKAKK